MRSTQSCPHPRSFSTKMGRTRYRPDEAQLGLIQRRSAGFRTDRCSWKGGGTRCGVGPHGEGRAPLPHLASAACLTLRTALRARGSFYSEPKCMGGGLWDRRRDQSQRTRPVCVSQSTDKKRTAENLGGDLHLSTTHPMTETQSFQREGVS